MTDLLKSAWDLHFHTAPDVSPRKYTDLQLANEWKNAGMKGGVIKCHYADTTGRAAILNELFPELAVYGGLVLNRQAGGINPAAVERMAQAGGKFLWFPTLEARAYQRWHHKNGPDTDLTVYLTVCDDDGNLLPAVHDVLDVAIQYCLIVGTGHIGEKEGLPLVKEALRRGVEKVVLTHAENPATRFSSEAQADCARSGAFVEHSCFTVYHNRVTWENTANQIRKAGAEQCILVTDFGQMNSPGSAEGLLEYAEGLIRCGIPEADVEMMIKENPLKLLEG